VNNLAHLFNLQLRRSEEGELLQRWYKISEKSARVVRYNLACYECIEGNLEEAKRLVEEHLKLHPEMKEQALQDSDFDTIKDFIETL
jgi:hypothetical protein